MDWISAIGSVFSFLGVLVAIYQITKARDAAEAAKISAESASETLQKNVAMINVSGCVNEIEEVKVLIRNERVESALLRVCDLIGKIIQLKSMPKRDGISEIAEISNMLAQLGVLRDLLEKKLHKTNTSINPSQINSILSSISDDLNVWIGENKYLLPEITNDQ